MFSDAQIATFVGSMIYTLFGVAVFAVTFFIVTKITPFSVRKEIEEDQNTALGIIIGSIIIGLAIIIGAAITG
jgi:putative membrane protein